MSRRLLELLLALALLTSCRTIPPPQPDVPVPPPIIAPIPAPAPTPVVVPVPEPPIVVTPPDGQVTSDAISRDVFNVVVTERDHREGKRLTEPVTTLNQLMALVGSTPLDPPHRIPQPGGGYLYRYKMLDSDGLWRGRHANFVVVGATVFRKSYS